MIGKGSRRQNYVDEADFARAVELSLGRAASGVFHIGGPASISNLDLAGLCIDTLGSSSTIEFLDRADPEEGFDWTIDPSRAAGELGYEARVPLRETIHAIATTFKR